MLTLASACRQNRENVNFAVRVYWKDVYNDLQLMKTKFELTTTLTLTQNANPSLCMHAKSRECELYG